MARATTAATSGGLSGRTVFLGFFAFFVVVAAVNAVMISAAVGTFGGTVTDSSYKAGIRFGSEQKAAEAQRLLGWRVEPEIATLAGEERRIVLSAVDAAGKPLGGSTATMRLQHPADARRDIAIPLLAVAPGRFAAEAAVPAGQWEVVVELDAVDAPPFHLERRVVLP